MAYRKPNIEFPAYPPINSDETLTPEDIRTVRARTSLDNRVNTHNTIYPAGRTRWGHPESLRVAGITVSKKPIKGVPTSLSAVPGTTLHAAFVTDKGESIGVSGVDASPGRDARRRSGTIAIDPDGRGWFKDDRPGSEPEPLSLKVPPVVKDFYLQGRGLIEQLPASGEFTIQHQRILAIHSPLKPSVDVSWLKGVLDREAAIRDEALAVITEEAFTSIVDTLSFPTKSGLFPEHDSPERRAFYDALDNLALNVIVRLRDAGLCEPCPNNGPRGVNGITEWNEFLTAKDDFSDDPLKLSRLLNFSPAFQVFRTILLEVSMKTEKRIWGEMNNKDDPSYGEMRDVNVPFSRDDALSLFPKFKKNIVRALCEEEIIQIGSELRGGLSSQMYGLTGSFLRPVLCDIRDQKKTPLQPIEEPKLVRHHVLTLPTGRLAMADWFRIPGFTEAMEEMSGETGGGFDINYANGLDERAKSYLTKAGVVIVQVGNNSPHAHQDGDWVWRMGRGPDPENDLSEPSWETCTDLWANTFASPEAIVNVLMTSGEYRSEADAEAALVKYCEETYGANIVDLGTQTLHAYVPTGYVETTRSEFPKIGEGVLSDGSWEDAYVLSTRELPVSPDVLCEEVWEAPELTGFETHEP